MDVVLIVMRVIASTAYYMLYALEFALFIRAIYSWFDPTMNSRIHNFVHALTEPVLTPVRKLLDRFNLFQGMPIDMSFTFTYLLIIILQTLIRLFLL